MKKVTVLDRQNIYDIAIQEYGNTEAVNLVIKDNGLDFDSVIRPGQVLKVRELAESRSDFDKLVYDGYRKEDRQVCTVNEAEESEYPHCFLKIEPEGSYALQGNKSRIKIEGNA